MLISNGIYFVTKAFSMLLLGADAGGVRIDLSIEGMRSQRFGVGVFIFLLIGILVYCGIIYSVARSSKHVKEPLKRGEKVMVGAIVLGVVLAVIFGATQMLSGVLF